MSTKILDLITKLESEIFESPKPKMGGANKRVVDIEALQDSIGDLRATIPEEVRVAQQILNERETLLSKAAQEVKAAYDNALLEREALIGEQEIIAEAKRRSQEIVQAARESARQITMGACTYADDILADLQRYLGDYSQIIDKNRGELRALYSRQAETSYTDQREGNGGEEPVYLTHPGDE